MQKWTMAAWRSHMPELSTMVGLWCALMSTFQGIGAIYGLVDRRRKKELEIGGTPVLTKFNPLLVSTILFIGTALTIAFGTWMVVAKPLRPTIKTVYVDRLIPCAPTKSGNATTRGAQSPANSGSNNTTTYGGSSATSEKPKPE
jgi:hypothetical protein